MSELGFTSVDGKLGMSSSITDGAAVWVHSREDGTSGLKVSTQFLYVDSSVLAQYQSTSAFAGAANSYGGINASAVYLQPKGGNVVGAVTPVVPSGGGGSQTVTVAAPTFSGDTQFTESTQVTMSSPAGASIFYTADGSTPTDQSLEYEEPITLSATTTVKAIAIKDGVSSSVTSRTYTKSAGGGDDEPGGDDH